MKPATVRHESGFVSLLTAILISLLLLTVTLSMVVLEVIQMRKAADAEQSLRAFYTAEAGVEDAVNKVLKGTVSADQNCTDASGNPISGSSQPNYDAAGAAGWTCQQIALSGAPAGKLDQPDMSKTVDPGSAPAYSSVLIEWDQSVGLSDSAPAVMPTQGDYAVSPFMPPLELTVIRYPDALVRTADFCTGSQTPNNSACRVLLQNALLVPGGVAAPGSFAYSGGFNIGAGPIRGNCLANRTTNPYYAATTYRCYKLLTGFVPADNYLFRLKSKYAASAYRMTFFDGLGNAVAVPDGTATIDVTAKAGHTYRRTITKVPINGGAAAGLDYVIFSDNGICKSFDTVDNVFPTAPFGLDPTCQ